MLTHVRIDPLRNRMIDDPNMGDIDALIPQNLFAHLHQSGGV